MTGHEVDLRTSLPEAPLNADSKTLLQARGDLPPAFSLGSDQVRSSRDEWRSALAGPSPELDRVDDVAVQPEHSDLPAIPSRVYKPRSRAACPTVLFLHGGGWVFGGLDHSDALCRWVAASGPCVVVNLAYRLAPADPYPAALRDVVAALRWCRDRAADWGADPARIAVMGCSAGANLCAAASLLARDGDAIMPAAQILAYPPMSPECTAPSFRRFADGPLLTTREMRWYWQQYLGDGLASADEYAAPSRATTLAGLPPALVITAEHDPVRDDGELYAERLAAAGVRTELVRFPGCVHGFMGFPGTLESARSAAKFTARFLTDVCSG